ncbi:MAG: ABC-2 family transporter protein [Planctomycetaceae bacterium]
MKSDTTTQPASTHPSYLRVFTMFLRNALIRDMTFRSNFIVEIITRAFWFTAQLVLFELIYQSVNRINDWSRYEYFAFMATGMLINAIVETFFMPNCANFSELIRKGDLDFVLLKPIDTQFLISFEKLNLAMLNQVLLAICLLVYSLWAPGYGGYFPAGYHLCVSDHHCCFLLLQHDDYPLQHQHLVRTQPGFV